MPGRYQPRVELADYDGVSHTVAPDPGGPSTSEATTVAVPAEAEYTSAHQIIAAAIRLRDAWALADLDVGEMHEAAIGLIYATGTTNLASALDVLHDIESGHSVSPGLTSASRHMRGTS
jgi:hypothetical protein